MSKIYLTILTIYLCVSCSGSDFTSPRNGGADAINEGDYLAERGSFPTELKGEKVNVRVEGTITFPVGVKDIDPSNLIITNGRLKELTRIDKNSFTVVLIPILKGDVTVQVPAGVVKSTFLDKPNEASNKITVNFKDYEVDSTLNTLSIPVATQPTSDPTKLVMIIDDSGSRVGDQARLAENLANSLESLKNKNVEVFAYSTTPFNDSSLASTQRRFVYDHAGRYQAVDNFITYGFSYHHSKTGDDIFYSKLSKAALTTTAHFIKNLANGPVSDLVTRDNGVLFDHDQISEKYHLAKSVFSSEDSTSLGSINFISNDNEAIRNSKIAAVSDAIKEFGTNGSDNELPLCTLLATLTNDGPNKIFSSDDRVAFMLVTDEDQTSVKCPVGFTSNYTKQEFVKTNIQIKYLAFYVKYDGLFSEDNGTTEVRTGTPNVGSNRACNPEDGSKPCANLIVGDKDGGNRRPCTTAEYSKYTNASSVTKNIAPDGKIHECYALLLTLPATTDVKIKFDANLTGESTDFVGLNKDGVEEVITSQTLSSYILENDPKIKTYEIHDDAVGFVNDNSRYLQTSAKVEFIAGVEEAGGIVNLIKNKAAATLKDGKYVITAISNKGSANSNKDTCGVKEESESKTINELADLSISICDNDYTPIFDWFNNFAKNEAIVTYQLPDDLEDFVGVSINGSEELLMENYYTIEGKTLTFKDKNMLDFSNGEALFIRYRK